MEYPRGVDADLECLLGYSGLSDDDILATLQFVLSLGYAVDSAIPVDGSGTPRELEVRDPAEALRLARSGVDASIIYNLVGRNLPVAVSFDFSHGVTTLSVYGGRMTRSVIARFLEMCQQVAQLRPPQRGYLGPERYRPAELVATGPAFDPGIFGPDHQDSLRQAYLLA